MKDFKPLGLFVCLALFLGLAATSSHAQTSYEGEKLTAQFDRVVKQMKGVYSRRDIQGSVVINGTPYGPKEIGSLYEPPGIDVCGADMDEVDPPRIGVQTDSPGDFCLDRPGIVLYPADPHGDSYSNVFASFCAHSKVGQDAEGKYFYRDYDMFEKEITRVTDSGTLVSREITNNRRNHDRERDLTYTLSLSGEDLTLTVDGEIRDPVSLRYDVTCTYTRVGKE